MNANNTYGAAAGLAVATALLPVWMYGALASEDDSPGLIFFAALVVAIIGAVIARFRSQGMARTMVGAAITQALVAVIEMMAWGQYLEISILNGFFIALWLGSAWLFLKAARLSRQLGDASS